MKTRSTSSLLVKKPIQYEFVPMKYCDFPFILNTLPAVSAKAVILAAGGIVVVTGDPLVVVVFKVVAVGAGAVVAKILLLDTRMRLGKKKKLTCSWNALRIKVILLEAIVA